MLMQRVWKYHIVKYENTHLWKENSYTEIINYYLTLQSSLAIYTDVYSLKYILHVTTFIVKKKSNCVMLTLLLILLIL